MKLEAPRFLWSIEFFAVAGLYVALILFFLFGNGCTRTEVINVLGPSSGGGLGASGEAVTTVRIEPSQFELTNGQGATAEVRAFVGALEARDFEFSVSVEPNQSVLTIVRIVGTRIDMKAERPGNTSLVVTVRPGVEARAPVTVFNAD